jgi:cathepsin A (carboxypeptidase C)
MKTLTSLVSISLLLCSSLTASAAPSIFDDALQTPFSLAEGRFRETATEWLDDGKKAILAGKKNLETWFHEGREYIKQNGLLCMWRSLLAA